MFFPPFRLTPRVTHPISSHLPPLLSFLTFFFFSHFLPPPPFLLNQLLFEQLFLYVSIACGRLRTAKRGRLPPRVLLFYSSNQPACFSSPTFLPLHFILDSKVNLLLYPSPRTSIPISNHAIVESDERDWT